MNIQEQSVTVLSANAVTPVILDTLIVRVIYLLSYIYMRQPASVVDWTHLFNTAFNR